MSNLRFRNHVEVYEITEGMDWKDIRLLPAWLAVERTLYECSCGLADCSCKTDLPPLSDYFEKVDNEPAP